jgi:glycolate oxidase iron-sulfur subunit
VLSAEGCEVVVPQAQGCCGALAEHAGEEHDAMAAARRLIDAFEGADVDAIVVNAAGCGSAMKRYGHLLRSDPAYAPRAQAFAGKCRDISEVLADLEPRAPRGVVPLRIAYHDACHLQHAQGVRIQPRRLLQQIPGVDVREIAESEICCGSAGIYNMLQPVAAAELRDRKVQNIIKTEAQAVVSSNPGCLLQIATGLESAGRPLPIMHLIEVIDRSIHEGQRVR